MERYLQMHGCVILVDSTMRGERVAVILEVTIWNYMDTYISSMPYSFMRADLVAYYIRIVNHE